MTQRQTLLQRMKAAGFTSYEYGRGPWIVLIHNKETDLEWRNEIRIVNLWIFTDVHGNTHVHYHPKIRDTEHSPHSPPVDTSMTELEIAEFIAKWRINMHATKSLLDYKPA